MKLKVTIRTDVSNFDIENIRENFWQPLVKENSNEQLVNNTVSTIGENYLLRQFPGELKKKIISDLDWQIRDIEKDFLGRDYLRLFEELRFGKLNIERFGNINEYYIAITTAIKENAELRKILFTSNENYIQLLEKRILATQFVFSVSNFKYASLGFDLNIEPEKKVIDFFDNNFDYLQVFFNGYVADTFNEQFNNNNSVVINYSVSLDNTSQPKIIQTMSKSSNSNNTDENVKSKLDKAKWYWAVANGSLLFPVLISIYLIYSYSDKLNKADEMQNQKLNIIFERQEKLINHYQEEIKRLEDIELKLLTASKKDSTATK